MHTMKYLIWIPISYCKTKFRKIRDIFEIMNFSALCMGETVNCWLEIKFYWICTMLRAARENLYCIIEKHPRKFCLLMTTMIGINRKFFRETIWLVDASAIWRQSNWGMTQKDREKCVVRITYCDDHRRVLIFSLLRLWCVQGFSKQQSFHGNKSTSTTNADNG